MRAALFYQPEKPLSMEEVEKPKIGDTDVLIRVKVCGICGSDVHIIHGETPVGKKPIILGHEISGIIEEKGSKVDSVEIGDRVCVDSIIFCGACKNCMSGRDNICKYWRLYGIHTDGGLAEYVKVRSVNCVRLPENVSFEEGAIITDAVATAYHAVKLADIQIGDTVVIYGCGGLGIHAVQLANMSGGEVVAIDVIDDKLKLAKKLGAKYTINAKEVDPIKEVLNITDNNGADIAMEFIGTVDTIVNTLNSVVRGGKAILVGLCGKDVAYDTRKIVRGQLQVIGSYAFTKKDIVDVVNLVSVGKLDLSHSITHRFPLEKVNQALETLEKNIGNPIRMVIEI